MVQMSLLEENRVIRNTYTVERLLGEGAFSEVYRVKHRFLGRQAMKIFKATGMTIQDIENDLSEAILLSSLRHQNIIQIYDANVLDTVHGICGYFTMEYISGGSLDRYWRSHGDELIPVEISLDVALQIARGLAVAHSKSPPVIHRDIKPKNIMINFSSNGIEAKICDFGLAKRVNPLTLMASAGGTRQFKPPEAFRDMQGDSCRGDIWSTGSILYLLLTDHMPYANKPGVEYFDTRDFTRPLTPPSQINPDVSPGVDDFLSRCLAIKPEKRIPTAIDFANELEVLMQFSEKQQRYAPFGVEIPDSQHRKEPATLGTQEMDERKKMINHALQMAHDYDRLNEAADILESAFNTWPDLKKRYERIVRDWRRGLSTVFIEER